MRRLVPIIVAAALFCAGVVCGWLMRGDGGRTGVVAPVRPAKAVGSQTTAPNGRDVRTSEADVAEPQFEEAIPAAAVRRERAKTVPTPTVEEVKGEDGLTVDERLGKFKRERPDEFAALQRRRGLGRVRPR